MKYWLTALAAAVITIAGGWFVLLNPGEVFVRVSPTRTAAVSLGLALMAAFGVGASVVALLALGGAIGRTARARRARRQARAERRRRDSLARAGELVWAGETAAARAALLAAPERAVPDVARLALLAETYLQDGDPATARAMLEGAPSAPRLLELLARACEELGDPPAAIDALERARRAAPTSPRLTARLRDLYAAHGRWRDAAALQAETLFSPQVPRRLAGRRDALLGFRYEAAMALPDDDRAAAELRALAREAPDFLPAWVSAGDRAVRAGRAPAGRRVWLRGLRHRPAAVLLGRIEELDAARGESARTGHLLRRLVDRHPTAPVLQLHLARWLTTHGEAERPEAVVAGLPESAAPLQRAVQGANALARGDAVAAAEAFAAAIGPELALAGPWACEACGADTPDWAGRCPACGRWDTLRAGAERPIASGDLIHPAKRSQGVPR